MAATTSYQSAVPTGRDGLWQLVRGELTKLRSVRRWSIALATAVVLSVMLSAASAAGSGTDVNQHPDFVLGPAGQPVVDDLRFVHLPLDGDGTISARVAGQENSHEDAAAGLMIKASVETGSPYAALLLTPAGGVRLEANFDTERSGPAVSAPRWLRLTRTGDAVTGYQSADGLTWSEVGTLRVPGLPQAAEVGLFANSPPKIEVQRSAGSTSVGARPTFGSATFDQVRVNDAEPSPASWRSDDVRGPMGKFGLDPGETMQAGGTFIVSGSGKIGPNAPVDDPVQVALFGLIAGLITMAVLGVLLVTSEYAKGMIRTSLAASPRRGRMLAAKTVVIAIAAFAIGLLAGVVSFLLTQPILRDRGFAPPAFQPVSMFDPPVLRALLGTSAFLAVVAVFGLGVGLIVRRSAAAITGVVGVVIVPILVATALPAGPAEWLMRLTPAGGFAMQRAKPPTETLVEPWAMLSPWAGLGVAGGYAAVFLALAWWLLRRRDA